MDILLDLFITFFKIGLFTFGGGYAMIPLIQQEVLAHGWLDESMILNMIGISESTPGPIAINMSTFIGSSQAGFLGAVVATIGVVLPSFIIILLVATIFIKVLKNKHVAGALSGVKPVIVGLILASGINILLKTIFENFSISGTSPLVLDYKALIIVAILSLILICYKVIKKKQFSSIILIIISIILGILIY